MQIDRQVQKDLRQILIFRAFLQKICQIHAGSRSDKRCLSKVFERGIRRLHYPNVEDRVVFRLEYCAPLGRTGW
jgi:hypothetical protein